MKEKKKKIYGVRVTLSEIKDTFIYAGSQAEAQSKVEALYNDDIESIEYNPGDELDSTIEADAEPVLDGDYSISIADENETAYSALQAEKTSE